MALISNMARTIKDKKEEKSRLMKKYDRDLSGDPDAAETFVATDIMDKGTWH